MDIHLILEWLDRRRDDAENDKMKSNILSTVTSFWQYPTGVSICPYMVMWIEFVSLFIYGDGYEC